MKKELFYVWLTEVRGLKKTAAQDRVSNCKKVVTFHGDLDLHYKKDSGKSLLELFVYSKAEHRENTPAKHSIPINGNVYEGTASYRQAINRYMDFKKYENEIANDES